MILTMAAAFSGGALVSTAWQAARRFRITPPGKKPSRKEEKAPPLPPGWARFGGARPETRGWPDDSVLAVAGLSKQSPEVLATLFEVATKLDVPVDTLATVIAHESGWDPAALYFREKNDDGTPRKRPFVAAGLCQLTVEAHLEGFSTWERVKEVTTWTAERQLREVVLPLWGKYGARVQGAHPGLGLMLNFLPDRAGALEDTVLGEKGAKGFSGRVYAMNVGLDTNSDGRISVTDVYESAARVCRRARGRRIRIDGSTWEASTTTARPFVPKSSASKGGAAPKALEPTPSPSTPPAEPANASVAPAEPANASIPSAETSTTSEEPAKAPPATPISPSAPARVLRLGDSSGGHLLAAIRENREEPPTWIDLLWEGRGHTSGIRLVVQVSAHAVRAPIEIEGLGKKLLRLPISYEEQIEVCRLRRWFPLTQTIADCLWKAARHINPPLLGKWGTKEESLDSSRRQRTMEWCVTFNDRIDAQIPADGWSQLWATEGKDWLVHQRIAERSDGKGAVNYGLHRTDGTPWQTPGGKHDCTYFDETQVLRAMKWHALHPETGEKVPIIDVLRQAGMPESILAPFKGIA